MGGSDYFKTFDLQFIAGRPYSPSDTVREFVVNETLLKKLGVRNPQDAIGKEINFWDGHVKANIVGVVRDFNVNSLRRPLAPVVMSTWKRVYQTINIKIKPGTEKTVLPFIEKLWTTTYPDYVYDYQFLDQTIENFYKQKDQLSQLYKIFAGIAIFISCLGLYGLVFSWPFRVQGSRYTESIRRVCAKYNLPIVEGIHVVNHTGIYRLLHQSPIISCMNG